jgi:hypothetical protein
MVLVILAISVSATATGSVVLRTKKAIAIWSPSGSVTIPILLTAPVIPVSLVNEVPVLYAMIVPAAIYISSVADLRWL